MELKQVRAGLSLEMPCFDSRGGGVRGIVGAYELGGAEGVWICNCGNTLFQRWLRNGAEWWMCINCGAEP